MEQMFTNEEIVDKILIAAGLVLFLIGTLFLGGSMFDQWVCALSWFFGTVFMVAGLGLYFKLFTASKGGLGIVLMSVSAVLMMTALISYSFSIFTTTTTGQTKPLFSRLWGGILPNVDINRIRPYDWLFKPLAEVGLFLFVAGLLLKLYYDAF